MPAQRFAVRQRDLSLAPYDSCVGGDVLEKNIAFIEWFGLE